MRRSYISSLIAGCILIASSYGENSKVLNESLTLNNSYLSSTSNLIVEGRKEIIFKEGYKLEILAKNSPAHETQNQLEFLLTDNQKRLEIRLTDIQANGPSKDDNVRLKYNFSNGEVLEFKASYLGDNRILVDSSISFQGKVISTYHEDTKDIGFPIIGPLIIQPLKVRPTIEKFLTSLDESYSEFSKHLILGQDPRIPFKELEIALIEAEKASLSAKKEDKTSSALSAMKSSLKVSFPKKASN